MESERPKCSKCVDEGKVIKNGKTKNGKQRYKCKRCRKSFVGNYSYKAYESGINDWVVSLLKESAGIRSISRLLGISTKTVMLRILGISKNVVLPMIPLGKSYEVDEMCTYIGNKSRRRYIAYSLRVDTREVLRFAIGTRTLKHLHKVIEPLLLSNAKRIHTDKLREYGSLIPGKTHRTKKNGTNHIERMNLTLRTHLKRLNRRTICYSKSLAMLVACLKIYFWG